MRGGKRPGAGKPKGYKHQQTLEKAAVRSAMLQRTLRAADTLWNAQYQKAVGSVMVFRIDEEIDENGKVKKIHTHITDPDEIKQFLDECEGANGYSGDKYYFITEVLPDGKSIDSMFDRAFGKAQQSIEIAEPDVRLQQIKRIIQVRAEEKGITYEQELKNYVEHYALPDIKEKLVSELEN